MSKQSSSNFRTAPLVLSALGATLAGGALFYYVYKRFGPRKTTVKVSKYVPPHNKEQLAHLRQVFDTCDLNKDGVVSRQELFSTLATNKDVEDLVGYRWREVFEEMDENNDGEITWDEFRDFMYRKAPVYVPPQKRQALLQVDALFKECDEDGDGFVTRQELYRALAANKHIEDMLGYKWAEVFDQMDTDGDGKISWHEFQYYLFHDAPGLKSGVYVPKQKQFLLQQVQHLFDICDKNHDGVVTKSEFYDALKTNPNVEELLGYKWAEVFEEIDEKQDGELTWPEFRQHFFKQAPVYVPPDKQHALSVAEAAFKKCDIDGDGVIVRNELVRTLRANPDIEELLGYKWNEVFDEMDRDHDEKVTWEEFRHFLFHKKPVYAPKGKAELLQRIQRAFQACDVNGDGYVTRQELEHGLANNADVQGLLGYKWSEVFSAMDLQKMDKFSWMQFKHMLFEKAPLIIPPAKKRMLTKFQTVFQASDTDATGVVPHTTLVRQFSNESLKEAKTDEEKELSKSMESVATLVQEYAGDKAEEHISWPELRHLILVAKIALPPATSATTTTTDGGSSTTSDAKPAAQ